MVGIIIFIAICVIIYRISKSNEETKKLMAQKDKQEHQAYSRCYSALRDLTEKYDKSFNRKELKKTCKYYQDRQELLRYLVNERHIPGTYASQYLNSHRNKPFMWEPGYLKNINIPEVEINLKKTQVPGLPQRINPSWQ